MDQNLDQIDENVSNDGIMEVSQENVQTTTARKGYSPTLFLSG
jgi:hypothetical protein